MPADVKDPEKTQGDVDNDFKNIVDNSLADLKGLGGGHDQKKAAKDEAKENKKENVSKKEQKARGEDDPLNQQHQKDKNVGHFSKLAKAAKQGKRGERMDAAKTLAKRYAMKRLRKAAMQKLATVVLANPYVIGAIAIGVFLILLIVIILGGDETVNTELINQTNKIPLTISKTGPETAQEGDQLVYQILVGYQGRAQDITISDRIPDGTEYIDSAPPAQFDPATKIATWSLKDYEASPEAGLNNINAVLTLRLRAAATNTHIVNLAQGTVIGAGFSGPISGDIAALLPNPLPPDPEGVEDSKNQALSATTEHRSIYEQVAAATGIPWQIFAGIHYREGNAAHNTSLVSGRPIGGNEPDVVAGPGCSSDAPQGVDDGLPEPFSGGCKFASMLDSGLYGGNLLKGKVGGEISSFEILVKALSRYNGGGNSNCGQGVPYGGCPRLFEGEDDPYALNFFDAKHKPMYKIYCYDYTKCDPPFEDPAPGTATVAKWTAQGVQ